MEAKVSKKKINDVKRIAELIDKFNTTMIASSSNLSSAGLQNLRKTLRGMGEIMFAKKSIAVRGIKAAKKEKISEAEKYVEESPVILFTEMDPFELAAILSDNKKSARAKPGQVAPNDIKVEEGPTDLLPGPILSELGIAGLKAGIVKGKVTIKESKVLAKKGEKVSKSAADILMKLEMTPFMVGLQPIVAYDSREKKIYANLKIDKEGSLASLKEAFSTALQFAIEIGYPAKEAITQIIEKAQREALALEKVVAESKPAEEKKEEAPKVEEAKAEESKAAKAEASPQAAKAEEPKAVDKSTEATKEDNTQK